MAASEQQLTAIDAARGSGPSGARALAGCAAMHAGMLRGLGRRDRLSLALPEVQA